MKQGLRYNLKDKTVLVTGGTGSFGKTFIKHLLEHEAPRKIVVYSRDELKQFEMANEINSPLVEYYIGDIRDLNRLTRVIKKGVNVIVHAAALKQVPTAEFNPMECIRTNILGGDNVISAAMDCGVERVVALSTDKASNPMNLYGATKLCSDKLFIAANQLSPKGGPQFSVVRYGNVIGSRGSVIPFFRERMSTGKLPITDPGMTRFWISLDEGVRMVVHSLEIMQGGEIFVPKLPSMKVVDLARAICPECELETIGIRPGERLYEVMVPMDEAANTFEFKNYYIIQPAFHWHNQDRGNVYDGEQGTPVAGNYEYRSDTNPDWMTTEQLRKVID
ncbi:MAG: UDP-N-acetylglucosamine 4,6-dehydratase (inverting) [Alphaproteobacteria bacterium]|nr:UDP-N-acetylglucosamine 4,6-dehydratase (inverting) [Alphaproteobacteria bacterium]